MKRESLKSIGSSENVFNSNIHRVKLSRQVTSKILEDDGLGKNGPDFDDFLISKEEKKEEEEKLSFWASVRGTHKTKELTEEEKFEKAKKEQWGGVKIKFQKKTNHSHGHSLSDTKLTKQDTAKRYNINKIAELSECQDHHRACQTRDIEDHNPMLRVDSLQVDNGGPSQKLKPTDMNKKKAHINCPCCGLAISDKELGFFESTEKFRKNTGAGCAQFFEQIKYYGYNLLIVIVVVIMYKVIYAETGKGCDSDQYIKKDYSCTGQWKLSQVSGGRGIENVDHVEKALIFLSVFLMMALNWYYIYWVNEVIDDWDDDDTTPYDYALMIQHLPTDTENFNTVKSYFKNTLKVLMPDDHHGLKVSSTLDQNLENDNEKTYKNVQVKSQVLCYYITDYIEKQKKNNQLRNALKALKELIKSKKGKICKLDNISTLSKGLSKAIARKYSESLRKKIDKEKSEDILACQDDECSSCSSIEDTNTDHDKCSETSKKLRIKVSEKIKYFKKVRLEKRDNIKLIAKYLEQAKSKRKTFNMAETLNKMQESNLAKAKKKCICCKNDNQKANDYLKFTGTAIITFNTQNQRNAVLKKFKLPWHQQIYKMWLRELGQLGDLADDVDGNECSSKEYSETFKDSNTLENKANVKITEDNNLLKTQVTKGLDRQDSHKQKECQSKKHKLCCGLGKLFTKDNIYKEDESFICVDIVKPPEPMDIQWENVGFHLGFWKWLLIRVLIILLYCVIMAIIYGLLHLERSNSHVGETDQEKESPSYRVQILSFVISICVSSSNAQLTLCFRIITAQEKHWTFTHSHEMLAKRVTYGQFINSALIVTIATFYLYSDNDNYARNTFADTGIAWQAFMIILANQYVHPFQIYFNPNYFIKMFQQAMVKRNLGKYNQATANVIFEPIQPEFAEWTADAASAVYTALFFLPIVPLGTILCFFTILVQFFADKHAILRWYGRPSVQSPDIPYKFIQYFDNALFVLAMGQVVWDLWFRAEVSVWSIALAVIMGVYKLFFVSIWIDTKFKNMLEKKKIEKEHSMLPENPTNKKDSPLKKRNSGVDGNTVYDDVRMKFITEYDRCNPLTAVKATQSWLQFLESKKEMISKNVPLVKNLFLKALGGLIQTGKVETGGQGNDNEHDIGDEKMDEFGLDVKALMSYTQKISNDKVDESNDQKDPEKMMLDFVFHKNDNKPSKFKGSNDPIDDQFQNFYAENKGFSNAILDLIQGKNNKPKEQLETIKESKFEQTGLFSDQSMRVPAPKQNYDALNNRNLDVLYQEDIEIVTQKNLSHVPLVDESLEK